MERYKNLGGNSSVVYYEIYPDSIVVQFNTGATYLYNYSRTGKANIEQMKILASAGEGLGSFINTVVRNAYERKIR